nr:MAG TPA: response regulator [Caudoviricetes sp.]
MESTEFYNTPEGCVMYKPIGKPVQELTIDSRAVIEEMLDTIKVRYPKAFKALCEQYTASELNRQVFEFNIVSRFCRCNFGEYDANTPDVDADGFFHFEEVKCPLRGECRMEGVICKPELDSKLTSRELQIIELISKGLQAQEIADRLFISVKTVQRHRENIKAKLQMRTLAQVSAYYLEHVKGK